MNVHSDVLKISASIVQGAEARVHRYDWNAIAIELNAQGSASGTWRLVSMKP
jgi:hypothetical protein